MYKLNIKPDGTYTVSRNVHTGKKINTMEELAKFAAQKINDIDSTREHLIVIFMDHKHNVICHAAMFSGDNKGAPIYPAIIAHHAALAGASTVAVAHNHPNGVALPSLKDMEATEELKRVLSSVGLCLTNSLVVTGDGSDFCDCLEIMNEAEAYKEKLINGTIKLGAPEQPKKEPKCTSRNAKSKSKPAPTKKRTAASAK